MVMPLIVGIVNGMDKGFNEVEIGLVNGFGFGMLATNAGVGFDVWNKITVEEFRRRMLLCNFANPIFKMEDFYDMLTIEFCERLKDADWYCNCATLDKRKFNSEYKKWLVNLNQSKFTSFLYDMDNRGEEE